jgi:hypothetical protein
MKKQNNMTSPKAYIFSIAESKHKEIVGMPDKLFKNLV